MIVVNMVTFLLVTIIVFYCLFRGGFFKKQSAICGFLPALNLDKGIKSQKISWLQWGTIAYFFILIRLIALTKIPGGINQDGAMAAVEANSLAQHLTDRFGTWIPVHLEGWGFAQMNALMSYLMIPFVKVLGLNKLSMRLPIFIISILGACIVVKMMWNMFGEKVAMIMAVFIAINPWHFMQSRWALESNMFPHFFIFGFCLLVMGVNNNKYMYLSMACFAISMYSYGVSFYMVPFFLLACCIFLLANRIIKVECVRKCLMIYLGIAWPIYLTMLINFMKWHTLSLPFATIQYFEGSVRAKDILFFSDNIPEQFGSNLRSMINVVFLQKEGLLWNNIPHFGTIYACSLPVVLLGVYLAGKEAVSGNEQGKRVFSFMLLSYWLFGLLLGVFINNVNINRINVINYANMIFLVIGVNYLFSTWKKAYVIIGLIYCIQSFLFFNTYFTNWADEIENVFYADFLEALDNVKEYDVDCFYITPDTQYENSWNVTEILVMFSYNIDSLYYRGVINEWNGKRIGYHDLFKYANVQEGEALSESTIYVIKSTDKDKFPKELFLVEDFGKYATAIPVGIAYMGN